MKRLVFRLAMLLLVMYAFPAFAQADISHAALKLGSISTFQSGWNNDSKNTRAFYPELEAGGRFFIPVLSWGINFGYWDDGLKDILFMDQETVTHKAYVLGLRVSYTPENFLFNSKTFFFSVQAGMNSTFSNRKSLTYPELPDVKENVVQPYLGIQLNYSILPHLYLLGEIGSNLGISKTHPGRPVFLGGAKFTF